MQVALQEESIVVEQKKAETDVLLVQVGQESPLPMSKRSSAPSKLRRSASSGARSRHSQHVNADLAAAEPAVEKAKRNNLDENAHRA